MAPCNNSRTHKKELPAIPSSHHRRLSW
jgi:hypothetical protein